MLEAVWIGFAFSIGLLVRFIGLPPLVGYLVAGFVIASVSDRIGMPSEDGEILSHVSHLGVLLLLFTVGLKLNVRNLVKTEVIGGCTSHFTLSVVLFTPIIALFFDVTLYSAILLAIALSFSSTVLAAKILETKRELRAFHGRVAIGILVAQDLIALVVMSVASGTTPSVWTLGVFALPLLRPLLFKLMDASGHEDLLMLFGLLLALVIGGYGFELVGLSSELGALVFGGMLAKHPRASELSKSLWSIKEFFLVGFFLEIGVGGLPDADAWWFAIAMTALLPLKAVLFFLLLVSFKLRARSAFLSGLSLSNYSEFGLIVASVALPEWLVPLALTVALSFVVSAPLNRVAHPLYERFARRLIPFERNIRHPDEQPVSLGYADVLIMGMGRTGTAAYKYLQDSCQIVALDSDPARVLKCTEDGYNIFFADAEDQMFWEDLDFGKVRAVILSLNEAEAKRIATQKLRQAGFEGIIVSHSMHEDEAAQIIAAGADQAYLTMSEAGVGLAEHVRQKIMPPRVHR
ncbi:cation:proton antiporter family protein [Nitrosomonas mobilis]|uniref:Putative Kef-type K+ transport system, NAD-binding component n=1 Tax=Nitrosomonas mobilis TaxID=51642 RepID=A0A1G5SC00_9PROT|nr:cation:proton antiporter family protein [Nitrosomonas mobilis]SCZ84682.1 putative Kef-type K+ transport system, NAD-binding component [Nitrosomonas mobilis]HNO75976.1 cation:proton antiporter [Nitrosomonas mobilis]